MNIGHSQVKGSSINDPALSVILPIYNAEQYVARAIESIVNQTFKNFQLIIVDDGSTDKTDIIIRKSIEYDPRIKYVRLHYNVGKVTASNFAIEYARGAYVTVHDGDDLSHRTRFSEQLKFLSANLNYAMCGTGYYCINEDGHIIDEIQMPDNMEEIRMNRFAYSQFHGPTMVLNSAILNKIGGLYRFFRNKEDVDLSIRILDKYEAINLKKALYYYRYNPKSLSKYNYDYLKFEGLKLIEILAEERNNYGRDCIMNEDWKTLEGHLKRLRYPYDQDKGLFYRKSASHNMYFNFYKNAIKQAARGVVADPYNIENIKTLLYCIKRWILDR